MVTKHKSWLLTAFFVLFGVLGVQAQNEILELVLDHNESDYVPAADANYYRNFFTINNLSGEVGLTAERIADGEDTFMFYRYDADWYQYFHDETEPELIEVALLKFSLVDEGVKYEITYMNQTPRENYDIDVVTVGILGVEDGIVNMEGITLVDQFSASLAEEDFGEFIWKYAYILELVDGEEYSNEVDVPIVLPYSYNLGFYKYDEMWADTDAKLTAGVKNADYYVDRVDESVLPVTAYSILRGDNTYPNVEISHMTALDCGEFVDFVEQSNFLPEYYGVQEHNGGMSRNDSSKVVLGQYGDFMTYAPIVWTDGEKRVKQDGDNSYGGTISKTGVAKLDVMVQGTATAPGSSDSWRDENGEMCVFFNPVFYVSATMPDNATWEYLPVRYRIWRKCNNVRYCLYNEATGQLVNDAEFPRETFELIADYEADEDETQVLFGDPDAYVYEFGATAASAEGGISFLVRLYYQVEPMIPLKYPLWMPMYYVVEQEVPWKDYTTAVAENNAGNVLGKTYYNLQGIASDTPYDGLNIVVTHYSDGTTKSTKVMR